MSMLSVPLPFMRPRDAQKSADKVRRAFASGCCDHLALLASLAKYGVSVHQSRQRTAAWSVRGYTHMRQSSEARGFVPLFFRREGVLACRTSLGARRRINAHASVYGVQAALHGFLRESDSEVDGSCLDVLHLVFLLVILFLGRDARLQGCTSDFVCTCRQNEGDTRASLTMAPRHSSLTFERSRRP